MWNGSGLKIDSAATDVVWCHGPYSSKILTSARNGELILWDLNRSGNSKYERRARDHVRSIHTLSYSVVSQNYCTTGSADGDLRVWDMRDLSKSIMRIHHPAAVRAVSISPVASKALQAITGLDNGSIYRWDLRMGQRVGSLAFIADKPKRWEVPFDDVNPEARQGLHNRRAKHKALGDRSYSPASQTFGTFVNNDSEEEVELFVKLARGYKFDGNDRASICAHNAGVAMNAGKESAAQAWFLLAALLMDIVTPPVINTQTPALSPLPLISPHLPHSTSAPAAVPTLSASNRGTAAGSNTNPGNSSRHSPDRQHSASASSTGFLSPSRTTPASSTAPSPHRKPVTLPVPVSIFARRGSGAGLPTHPVHPSSSIPSPRSRLMSTNSRRKPSFSNSTPSLYSVSLQSEAAEGKTGSGLSLKHVGDGALDDSDDEEEGSSHGGSDIETDDENIGGGFDDNWGSVRSLKSDNGGAPSLTAETPSSARHPFVHRSSSTSANTHSNPSPLSRVAGQQTWTEDEDERGNDEDNEDSPSPASSSDSDGTDLSDNDQPDSRVNSKGKTSSMKRSRSNRTTRSRSSTVASLSVEAHLAAPGSSLSIHLPKLTKQESSSSIRTVTAVNSPHPDNESQKGIPHILTRDDTIRDLSHSNSLNHDDAHSYKPPSSFRQAHKRVRSSLSTEFFIDREVATPSAVSNDEDLIEVKTPASWYEETRAMELESHMRDAGWDALRETLEIYADEGDVQMCTMLSLVAAQELKVNRSRLLRFLEAYIEMLVRLRLHESAAYMRKNAPVDEIRNITGVCNGFVAIKISPNTVH
ncbi:hypothetical protein EUX98_g6214 [Antrodiella citrinella]|uniref:Uncharacterized protein n=1 Tax=Antrodiella citrinella TaxID=2447956 RepID=A0A4S4MX34_9APHY|nr:hypothetical protein EUX98_g6214 [Antrodiella citrinella]